MSKDNPNTNRVVFYCDDRLYRRLKVEADKQALTRGQFARAVILKNLEETEYEPI